MQQISFTGKLIKKNFRYKGDINSSNNNDTPLWFLQYEKLSRYGNLCKVVLKSNQAKYRYSHNKISYSKKTKGNNSVNKNNRYIVNAHNILFWSCDHAYQVTIKSY